MAKKFEISTTLSPTGANLCLYQMFAKISPKTDIKGVVHINHGMAEYGARYQRFANSLVENGYHVIAQDHRGHGNTRAEDAPLGVFSNKNGLQKAIDDIAHVNSYTRDKYPDLPIILFGHSMGTILGFNYCLHHPDTINATALWNTGFDTGLLTIIFKFLLKIERFFKGSDVSSSFAQKITFEDWNKKFAPNRTPFDWLSRDEFQVDKYVADPLCGFSVSIGLWLNVLEAINFAADDANLAPLPKSLPFHLCAGSVDPCSNKGEAVAQFSDRLQKAGLQNVTFQLLPDTRHESLNEINRDETIANFITWLDANFV